MLQEMDGQCICKACAVSAKVCIIKRKRGKDYKFRWPVRDIHAVSHQIGNVCTHPFSVSVGIASVEDDSTLLRPTLHKPYQLDYRIDTYYVSELVNEFLQVSQFLFQLSNDLIVQILDFNKGVKEFVTRHTLSPSTI